MNLISAIASSDRGAMNSCDWFFSFLLSFFLSFLWLDDDDCCLFVPILEFEEMPGCWKIGGKRKMVIGDTHVKRKGITRYCRSIISLPGSC